MKDTIFIRFMVAIGAIRVWGNSKFRYSKYRLWHPITIICIFGCVIFCLTYGIFPFMREIYYDLKDIFCTTKQHSK